MPSLAGGNVSTDVTLLGSKRIEVATSTDNCAAFRNLTRREMNNNTCSKTHPEGPLCAGADVVTAVCVEQLGQVRGPF